VFLGRERVAGEPEWDEDSREVAYALYYDELERCKRCGLLHSECSDPKRVHYPQRSICYATMEREAAVRTYQRLHEALPYHDGKFSSWSKNASASYPYHFMDGVVIFTALEDLNPKDSFLSSPDPFRNDDDEGGDDVDHTP
jgi:hypothetical protein